MRHFSNKTPHLFLALCICFAPIPLSANEEDQTVGLIDSSDGILPFDSVSSFPIPQDFQNLIGDYRNNWTRLTGYEFSGLHWNHFVVIYVNKEPEVYAYNYTEYAKYYSDGFDDDDDWDDEEEEDSGPAFQKYSEGTAFLKEHFSSKEGRPDKETMITAMIKREEGYDPDFGDWQYVWMDTQSNTVLQNGNSTNKVLYQSCIECHANMAERDYIFSTFSRSSFE